MPFVNKARRIDPILRKTNIGLTKREKEIYTIYSNAFKGVRNQIGDQKVLRDILDALRTNSASGVNNAINWRTFLESLSGTVPALAGQVAEVATIHSKILPKKVRYEYNFESKDPRAIAWAQTQAGKRIQGITLETQQAVSDLIADGLRTKLSREEIVASLRQTVGLDRRQSKALGNFYMRRLEKYLEDGLTYEQAAAKAEKMGVRYRDKLLRQRAIRIARTEISAAANAGRYLSWEEANARGLLPPDSQKRWITSGLEKTCDVCRPMNGTLIPWKATFSTGDLMPPAHPNCMCTGVIVPGEIQVIKSVQKHAPGKHNQQSHAGGRSGKDFGPVYEDLGLFMYDYDNNNDELKQQERDELSTKQKGDWLESEALAVAAYQGGKNSDINDDLRDADGKLDVQSAAYTLLIDDAIKKSKPLDKEITVYRGVKTGAGSRIRSTEGEKSAKSFFDELQEGDEFSDLAFISTTLNPRVAANFADLNSGPNYQGLLFRINVPTSVTGVFMNSINPKAGFNGEIEYLLPRGSTFKLLRKAGKVWDLEAVSGQ